MRNRFGHLLGSRIDRQAMFMLAIPALFENLLATLAQFVDTAMVGSLGASATAAVAVNATPMWLLNGMVSAIGVGGTAVVARLIGAKDREGAEKAYRQVFLAVLTFAAILCILAESVAGLIPRWMRADPALHQTAATYMRVVAAGFIPHFTGMALGASLRGAGDTRTPMFVSTTANLLNVVGNFLLIYPARVITVFGLSLPMWGAGLGVIGAGISTAACNTMAGIALLLLVTRSRSRLQLKLRRLRPDGEMLRRILRIGLPASLERVTISTGQMFYVGMVAALGTAELAAHHLSITVESLSYMPGFAFGVAATTLVGQSLGAKELQRAKERGALTIRYAVGVMSLIGVGLFVFAPVLIGLLTPDPAVRMIGAQLIRICAFEQPFMAMEMVGAGALRGAGDTRAPFFIALTGMWGVRIVLAWLFMTQFGWGVNGAWYAMVTDLGVRSLLIMIRFFRGKWMTARV
ncbi:MAG: MATE family efflux transporter [Oscillospiraceae bacterium]|jgi:putative MATE family efflux protein|nr:MATE family efflux transporter [Oscillospiraceae bacterium]